MNDIEIVEHENFLEYVVDQPNVPGGDGGEDWWRCKKGVPSASNFDRIITPVRGELSKQADDYAAELIGDLLSEIPPEFVESFTNRATRWGTVAEQDARNWYSFQTGLEVRRAGWLTTKDGRYGCSPDSLVGETGGLELKAPQSKQHTLNCLYPDKFTLQHRCQVHGALWITKRPWWSLVSFCPGLPGLHIRITPDDFTEKLGKALEQFWPQYQAALARVKAM